MARDNQPLNFIMARILIIDDENDLRESLSVLLSGAGHAVDTAKDGFEGLQQMRATPADVVLCDIIMPYGGIATIRVLRNEFPAVGIIAISGSGQRRLDMSVGIGADEYLAKPFRAAELLAAIDRRLAKTNGGPSAPSTPAS